MKNKSRRTLEGNLRESKENGEWIKRAEVGDVAYFPFLNALPFANKCLLASALFFKL